MTKEGIAPAAIQTHQAPVDLNHILRTVLESRECSQRTRNFRFTVDLAENLPNVLGNSNEIQQVLLKLVVNAEEAIGENLERTGQIHVKTAVERRRAHLTVTDNGRGIHSRDMACLFNNHGAYVDLTSCAELVRDHGGELYAWSRYGKGSIFTLELPIHIGIEQQEVRLPGRGQDMDGKRILVIDDEVHICALMSDLLEAQGAKIDVANSGMEAVEQIRNKQYDLFICDQNMPGLGGEELYWLIHSESPELRHRFLFVTGDILSDEITNFFHQTGVRYISKPFRTAELIAAIEQVLSRSQQLDF